MKNYPDSNVRICAVQNTNSDENIMEVAQNDPDWRVRKTAIENLKRYMDSHISFFPDTHYTVNEKYIKVLEKIEKDDCESEVRAAAEKTCK